MNSIVQLLAVALLATTITTRAQPQDADGPGGPPGFGPGGFGGPPGFGGPGGGPGMGQSIKLVKEFDRNGDKRLDAAERKAARESLAQQPSGGRGRRGPGGPGWNNSRGTPTPGPKLTPADVKVYPDAPLYDPGVLRTLFLEFENADWEKELAEFKNTDVEVPARLTVDGKTYPEVGVSFHGMSSFMMVGEGQKRSLTLSMDFADENQKLLGYHTINLLNAHEDPSFLHTVLSQHIARDYIPAPKANLVRVVINGESWGVYVNSQHFNKEFTKDAFGTTKGARWKTPGSPNGQASLAYLGDDPARYKGTYEIKSKDNAKSWKDLIQLCKVLTETPPAQLEAALSPILDIDGALKFLAIENVLANNDGYWTRACDYSLYQDEKGRFHIVPYDANEAFSAGGGPGGPGGFGGGGGRAGGPGGFGPGMFIGRAILQQADKDQDGKLKHAEFTGVASDWFDQLDPDHTGKMNQDAFVDGFSNLLAPREGSGPPDGGPQDGRRGRFGPGRFIGPGLFTAADANKDGSLTKPEFAAAFAKWATDWDTQKTGTLTEESIVAGLNQVLPQPNFGGRSGPGGMRGGMRGGPGGGGIQLDPLVAAEDSSKTLIQKLLAVPTLRTRYLGYVHDVATKWLDWNRLGPIAQQYHDLIAADVRADTRKLESTEDFASSLTGSAAPAAESAGARRGPGGFGGAKVSLKSFADQRRAYLLGLPQVKAAASK